MGTSLSKGIALENRIQRLLFQQGYFAIRNIYLSGYSQAKGASTPDIDVLGYIFTKDFIPIKVIYDCRTSSGQIVNRILWLQTLSRRIGANRAYMVRPKVKKDIKMYGLSEGINIVDFTNLESIEKSCSKNMASFQGSAGDSYVLLPIEVRSKNKHPVLGQAIRLIQTDFWFLPSYTAMKRTIGQYEKVMPYTTVPGISAHALNWIKAMLINLFVVGVLRIAGETLCLNDKEREDMLKQRLITEKLPHAEFMLLVKDIFEYAYSVYGRQAGLPFGSHHEIPPPDYADSLLDLVTRVLKNPEEAQLMPRFSECVLFDCILSGQSIDSSAMENYLKRSYTDLLRHYRDYLFFLNDRCQNTRDFLSILFPAT